MMGNFFLAMQKKPDGETRNPTDIWSGMGFSKSMPESVIRERMQRIQGVLAYCEPTMETTYEVRLKSHFIVKITMSRLLKMKMQH